MRYKRIIPLVLFLISALLSAWVSPVLGVEQGKPTLSVPESVITVRMVGRTMLNRDNALDGYISTTPAIQVASLQEAISLLLWEEDSQLYLPIVER
jgi:hypothetical protein